MADLIARLRDLASSLEEAAIDLYGDRMENETVDDEIKDAMADCYADVAGDIRRIIQEGDA